MMSRRVSAVGRFFRMGASAGLAGTLACTPIANAAAPSSGGTVIYKGYREPAGSSRAVYQKLILDLAAIWANCDADLMRRTLSSNVDFSYPGRRLIGIDAALADLQGFCAVATERSIYFPEQAFYIDTRNHRIAAEVQFRVTQGGQKQVVNDVWIATIDKGRITVIKEYLDGRVRHLQAEGVLTYGEDAPFLTPWPPRVEPPGK